MYIGDKRRGMATRGNCIINRKMFEYTKTALDRMMTLKLLRHIWTTKQIFSNTTSNFKVSSNSSIVIW